MDSVEYLGASGSMLSLNLYAYCENNPVMNVDPDGYFPWIILLIASLITAVVLDDHSTYKYESRINEIDLNINGDNPLGEIKIEINETSIQIVDSYKIQNEKDMEKIINIVMNHHYYNMYGYDRSERSYLSEWKAHNAAYSFYKKGNWGD